MAYTLPHTPGQKGNEERTQSSVCFWETLSLPPTLPLLQHSHLTTQSTLETTGLTPTCPVPLSTPVTHSPRSSFITPAPNMALHIPLCLHCPCPTSKSVPSGTHVHQQQDPLHSQLLGNFPSTSCSTPKSALPSHIPPKQRLFSHPQTSHHWVWR